MTTINRLHPPIVMIIKEEMKNLIVPVHPPRHERALTRYVSVTSVRLRLLIGNVAVLDPV